MELFARAEVVTKRVEVEEYIREKYGGHRVLLDHQHATLFGGDRGARIVVLGAAGQGVTMSRQTLERAAVVAAEQAAKCNIPVVTLKLSALFDNSPSAKVHISPAPPPAPRPKDASPPVINTPVACDIPKFVRRMRRRNARITQPAPRARQPRYIACVRA